MGLAYPFGSDIGAVPGLPCLWRGSGPLAWKCRGFRSPGRPTGALYASMAWPDPCGD